MFNPQFSLFQPVPEGGTTFQPNPNSVIQNDEARGTNHLDFFKFVGRVVGKVRWVTDTKGWDDGVGRCANRLELFSSVGRVAGKVRGV